MKDKTDSMNSGNPVKGFEKIPSSQVPTRRAYKRDQLEGAGLYDVLIPFEDKEVVSDVGDFGGFLPRNNTSDRF